MRVVLDTTILVRANDHAGGLARELLLSLVAGPHTLVLSAEILYELARVLRYPRLLAFYKLSEEDVYRYIGFLHEAAEIVPLDPLILAPVPDVNDVVVMQTALLSGADVLCTQDRDFFDPPAADYLARMGEKVIDDIGLLRRLQP